MRKILTFALLTLIVSAAATTSAAQTITRDLYGFRLGQFRSVTHRELGRPDQVGDSDADIAYEAFAISDDAELYMVFQYQKSNPEVIWSIQITGSDPKRDLGFRGLRMGAAPSEVEKQVGKPARKIDAGEHGTRWEFEKANFSVEISPAKKLSSVRIVDERPKEPDMKAAPKFQDVVKILQTGTNAEVADLLAPDVELYEGERSKVFGWSMKSEIADDRSTIFATIRRLAKELSSVDPSKPEQYDEKTRLRQSGDMQPVIQLPKLSGVREITFQWNGEKWQIWEFGARALKPEPADWKSIYSPGSLKELVSKRIPDLIKTPNVALNKADGKPLASFSYNSYPTSTRVKFTGETRKTADSTLSLISLWLETLGKSKELAKRFEFEFKVVENGIEYWLPIQHPIPERLTKEVKKDDEITIYLAWIGIRFEGDRPDLLAIVNEFAAITK